MPVPDILASIAVLHSELGKGLFFTPEVLTKLSKEKLRLGVKKFRVSIRISRICGSGGVFGCLIMEVDRQTYCWRVGDSGATADSTTITSPYLFN
jgi:hypothetical protein